MALDVYNRITSQDQYISWTGFKLAMDINSIDNVTDFWDYMGIIKYSILNFDKIYYIRTNTKEVDVINNLINSQKKKKGK